MPDADSEITSNSLKWKTVLEPAGYSRTVGLREGHPQATLPPIPDILVREIADLFHLRRQHESRLPAA